MIQQLFNQIKVLTLLRLFTSLLLLWTAFASHSYGFYTIVRWITFGVASYICFLSARSKSPGWTWFFGLTALLFNPFQPISLGRQSWIVVDVGIASIFMFSIFVKHNLEQLTNSVK